MAQAPDGSPIPWYTYPAIDFLAQRDFSGKSVLEFGGGQSSLWWAGRAANVLTIEEDEAWHRQLVSRLPASVGLHHVPVDSETRSISAVTDLLDGERKLFDVIVIDGHLRRELLAESFSRLAPRGAIIFDNSDGYGFQDEVKDRACRRVDFFGFAPGVSARHCTSIVFVDDCFLLDPQAPLAPLDRG